MQWHRHNTYEQMKKAQTKAPTSQWYAVASSRWHTSRTSTWLASWTAGDRYQGNVPIAAWGLSGGRVRIWCCSTIDRNLPLLGCGSISWCLIIPIVCLLELLKNVPTLLLKLIVLSQQFIVLPGLLAWAQISISISSSICGERLCLWNMCLFAWISLLKRSLLNCLSFFRELLLCLW